MGFNALVEKFSESFHLLFHPLDWAPQWRKVSEAENIKSTCTTFSLSNRKARSLRKERIDGRGTSQEDDGELHEGVREPDKPGHVLVIVVVSLSSHHLPDDVECHFVEEVVLGVYQAVFAGPG